jgi:hypothetical protein
LFWDFDLLYSGCDPAHVAKVRHLPGFKTFRACGNSGFLLLFGHSFGSAEFKFSEFKLSRNLLFDLEEPVTWNWPGFKG